MYIVMNKVLPDQPPLKKSPSFRNEWILRLIATPFFAIFVSTITPLVYPQIDSQSNLFISYAYFTFLVHLLWVCNRWIVFTLRKSNYWIRKPVFKSFTFVSIHLVFSFLLAIILHLIWNNFITAIPVSNSTLLLASFIAAILSIMVASMYEIVLLTKERKIDLFTAEKLGHAKTQAELDTLRSQIDPHFIFNSLNTLSELITEDQGKAITFNENLANVYRYILANRCNDLVTVKEEVDFITSYFSLLKIRFENSLNITIKVENLSLLHYYLPTIAIQTAIENAIKHNQFSGSIPLNISIEFDNDYAIISNNKRPLKYKATSSGVGLSNLDNRYKLILNKSIHIDEKPDLFAIYLPITKK